MSMQTEAVGERLDALKAAWRACNAAREALQRTCPNRRDYSDEDVFQTVRGCYGADLAAIKDAMSHLAARAKAIQTGR